MISGGWGLLLNVFSKIFRNLQCLECWLIFRVLLLYRYTMQSNLLKVTKSEGEFKLCLIAHPLHPWHVSWNRKRGLTLAVIIALVLTWAFVFINYLGGCLSEKSLIFYDLLWNAVEHWKAVCRTFECFSGQSSSRMLKPNPITYSHLTVNLFIFKPQCETAPWKCNLILKVRQSTIKCLKSKKYASLKPQELSGKPLAKVNWWNSLSLLNCTSG